MQIGIVGLGTIGGSFAKSIKLYSPHTVYGADQNPDAVVYALFSDAIDGELREDTLQECDVLLLALYPQATVEYLQKVAGLLKKGAVAVDCCGIKRAIFAQCTQLAADNGFYFIGGHPMAGAVASGFRASREKMFKNASMILVRGNCEELSVLDELYGMFRAVGFSKIVMTSPEEHDRMIAFTSQLPHIISNAYVKSPVAGKHRGFSAGSYRDMARVAELNVPMWTELFLENSDFLAEELDILIGNLVLYKKALQEQDEQTLASLLREGASCKAAADSAGSKE